MAVLKGDRPPPSASLTNGLEHRLLRLFCGLVFLLSFNGALVLAMGYFMARAMEFDPFRNQALSHCRRVAPPEIEVDSLLAYGSDSNLLALAVGLGGGACGGYAYSLTDRFATEVEVHGMTRPDPARSWPSPPSRQEGPPRLPPRESPWQPTPVPVSWTIGDGDWPGLGCLAGRARGFDFRPIVAAANETGAFYAARGVHQLLVVPRLRLLIVTYYGTP